MVTKPSILFVPGAWHVPESYDAVSKRLDQAGYPWHYVNLPSVGSNPPLKDFEPDVQAIRSTLSSLVEAGNNVIVVVHSYGSMPANEAIKGLEKSTRAADGKQGGVIHYVFCSAFITPEGVSLMDALQGNDLPWFIVNEEKTVVNPDNPADVFYGDLEEHVAKEWVDKLKPFSYRTYFSKTAYAAYKHVPATFIYCTQDKAIPHPVQQMMVQGSGVEFNTVTLEASHSPMISQPGEVAKAIRQAAGEQV